MTNKKFNEEQNLVYRILTENTGKHFLDSGGHYGRHWERNQSKSIEEFWKEDEQSYKLWNLGERKENGQRAHLSLERSVSVFHFLAGNGSNLELDPICDTFNRVVDMAQESDDRTSKEYPEDCPFYGVLRPAWEYLCSLEGFDQNDKDIRTWNTYNGDCDLSQILQGGNLTINDEPYRIIQVHGGCDARGGYSDARLFKISSDYDPMNEYLQEYIYDDVLEYLMHHGDFYDAGKKCMRSVEELTEDEKLHLEEV